MSTLFLLSWDMTGLEVCINVTELDKKRMWDALSDNKDNSISLNSLVNNILLRARYNAQRHYEVYTVNVTEGITEEDLRQMFENDPQTAADLIRDRGHKLYSDRIPTATQRIV